MRVVGITGRKNSGKTTLTERLVAEFTARGFTVSTVKHAHHETDVDQKGRDSYRHRAAGAKQVMLSSDKRWALMHELRGDAEPELAELLARMDPVDLVLVEGYKNTAHPKIEIWRHATAGTALAPDYPSICAMASDQGDAGTGLPVLDPNDIAAIADFITRHIGLDALKKTGSSMPPGIDWTPVDAVLARLQASVKPITAQIRLPLAQAAGHVLAEDACARISHPPLDNSAVDGYGFAFDTVDFSKGPVPLVAGRAAAGEPFAAALPAGHAIRILTGAILPAGVDTVVLQEHALVSAAGLGVTKAPKKSGANTRKAGEDMAKGDIAFPKGRMLRAQDIGLAASLGIAQVSVHPRLRVGVLSTGSELLDLDRAEITPGKIPDANRPMLLAALTRAGFEAIDLGICPDERDTLRAILDDAAGKVDAILTSGGASQGDEDHVANLLRAESDLQDWRIAVKPGRPLALAHWPKGQAAQIPIFGLPGNPVAAMVCTLVFALPALFQRAGAPWRAPQGFMVPADFTKVKQAGRHEYLRARLSAAGHAEVFGSEGSGRVSGLAWADGLVELPAGFADIQKGTLVRFIPWSGFGL